jgi:hypothetical protein
MALRSAGMSSRKGAPHNRNAGIAFMSVGDELGGKVHAIADAHYQQDALWNFGDDIARQYLQADEKRQINRLRIAVFPTPAAQRLFVSIRVTV